MSRISPLLALVLVVLGVFSCKTEKAQRNESLPKEAKGGKEYGGVFSVNETEYIKTLYPPNITDAYSYRIATQIYEGLFKFNPANLDIVNGLAESYQTDSSRTVYTVKLRKNVLFHDDACFSGGEGREVTAEDVKYCFTKLCTQSKNNQGFFIFQGILKGADAHYEASAGGKTPSKEIEGIKVVDKYTIKFSLTRPSSVFVYNLARPFTFIYPKEALEKYGDEMRIKTVGTGPFYMANIDEGNAIVLKRNSRYYLSDELGNKLPFLEAIKISFIKEKKMEFLEFEKGNLDMMYRLPTESIIEIMEKAQKDTINKTFELERTPEMTTQFLTFMTQKGIFKDKNIRKAFSYAIDRQKILDFVLEGEGEAPGEHGITPPVFAKYDINKVKGYNFNLDSAQYYLRKAGFANGDKFPELVLHLNAEGERQTNVAVEVQKQLKENLNVNVKINVQPFAQLIERSLQGDFELLRAAWYAEYPNPENFLWLFWGGHVPKTLEEKVFPNTPRFKDAKYDDFYQKALQAPNPEEAYKLLAQAEQILMDEAVILVLWYDEAYRIMKPYVKDCPNNPMQYRDFSRVYFKGKKK